MFLSNFPFSVPPFFVDFCSYSRRALLKVTVSSFEYIMPTVNLPRDLLFERLNRKFSKLTCSLEFQFYMNRISVLKRLLCYIYFSGGRV